MKKRIVNLSTLCVAIFFTSNVLAQKPTANIYERTMAITIDGIANEWDLVPAILIDRPFMNEKPSLNSATWKAVWDDKAIYIAIEVDDDIWAHIFEMSETWYSDGAELYFDVSNPLEDGGGPAHLEQRYAGNYQIAPDMYEIQSFVNITDGDTPGVAYANTYNGTGLYCIEYQVPWTAILQNGVAINPHINTIIGFDVTIIDMDSQEAGPRPCIRAVWANSGPNESWNNMDDVGLISLMPNKIIENVSKRNILVSTYTTNYIMVNKDANEVSILNIAGQVVKTSPNLLVGSYLDISGLSKGIYILWAKTIHGEIIANRFVKQ